MLRGRVRERARIEALLAHEPASLQALCIEGEPGIGKSTLVAHAVSRAGESGVRVLACRPGQAELGRSHSALLELLASIEPEAIDRLHGPQGRALRVVLRWEVPGNETVDPQTVAAALATVIADVAAAQPVLVVVDDLHWLDADSGAALEYALRRQDPDRVRVLTAARLGVGVLPRPIDRAIRPELLDRVICEPLDVADIRDLIAERTGRTISERLSRRIHDVARGNPFVALEIARALPVDGPADPLELPVPGDVSALVDARLEGLAPAARSALLEIALSHVPAALPARHERAVARTGIVRIDDAGAVHFTHPLYEAAVRDLATPGERRAMHRRLAARASDDETRALHLAAATDGTDAAAADTIEAGALVALARGALDVATRLAERAWQTTPPSPTRSERALQFALCSLRTGAMEDADAALAELAGSADGPLLARTLRQRGEALMWVGSADQAIASFEQALEIPGIDAAERAGLHLSLAFACYQRGRTLDEVVHHGSAAVTAAEQAEAPGPLAAALAVQAVCTWLAGGDGSRDLERAIAIGELEPTVPIQFRPRIVQAIIIGNEGRLADAIGILNRELDECLVAGAIGDVPYICVHLGPIARDHGDRLGATRAAAASMEVADEVGGPFPLVAALTQQAGLEAMCGDPVRAREDCRHAITVAEEAGLEFTAVWAAGDLAAMELALGDPQAAARWLDPYVTRPEDDAGPHPDVRFVLPDWIEARAADDSEDVDRALALLEPGCPELGRLRHEALVERCVAIRAAAAGDLEAAQAAAQRSAELLAPSEFRIQHGRSELVLGQIARRRRKRGVARTALQAAVDAFADAGAVHWERRARAELERTWASGAGREGVLTPSERRIAGLASEGLTNREIGERLFVSARTVEATLSSAYRKLGIRNRGGLRRALDAVTVEAPSG